MKRSILGLIFITVLILTSNFYVEHAEAQSSDAYTLEWVNHTIEIMYNGYIFINDTIKISGTTPDIFLIGIPDDYGSFVLRCVAYDAANPSQKYPVTPNVTIDNRSGFYGVKVSLPPQSNVQIFTVGFILSNSLLKQDAQNTSIYTLDFPAYPSLKTTVPNCNVSIVLPQNAVYLNGTVDGFIYSKNDVPAFTHEPANVTFTLNGDYVVLVKVEEFNREIRIEGSGEIEVTDNYRLTNLSPKEITSFNVVLPPNASSLAVEGEFGRRAEPPNLVNAETNCYRASLILPLGSNSTAKFNVKYSLPRTIYLKQESSTSFEFSLPVFQNMNYYIEKADVTFILPEGAKIKILNFSDPNSVSGYNIIEDVFREGAGVTKQGVFYLDRFTIKTVYDYNPLWLAFRPTLWIWVLATAGCAIAVILKRPKAPAPVVMPTVAAKFGPEVITSFVSLYEEKIKIMSELESLEAGVRKGRIPRRRYKVEKKTLGFRLNTLNRNLNDLKQKLRSAGGRYADFIRQLDSAEAEISEVEEKIRAIEVRHRLGEMSLEAYRKLLVEYEQKKENAETRISGILMRLREELQ